MLVMRRVHVIFLMTSLFITSCQKQDVLDDFKIVLADDWQLISSAENDEMPQKLNPSVIELNTPYKTNVPSTVLAALVKNGVYVDPYFGKNLEKIPTEQFDNSWWYIKKFNLKNGQNNKNATLKFDGINYRANVWLNGRQIAASDTLAGAYRCFEFDVSGELIAGQNVLAVEVFPPQPGEFTIGYVDWNPSPPDKNMGIFRPVTLALSGPVSVNNPFVRSKIDLETLESAKLTIEAELRNHSANEVAATLKGEIEQIKFDKKITLAGGENKTIRLTADEHKELLIDTPRLWWPNGYGEANLYSLKLDIAIDGKLSDSKTISFGIRDIEDYFNEQGHRGYRINGKEILIKGAGWVDDLLLADTPEKLEAQVKYAKHLNLNTLRLEGFWGSDQTLYNLCDRYGIMIMVGWSCHWEWEDFIGKACDDFGGIKSLSEIDLISRSWRDQITMLRNHPSIFVWLGGSDKLPRPELEKRYLETLEEIDGERTYLGAAGDLESEVSGRTGVKMNGPYAFTPPIYWYMDRKYGGAFGFNTETGPGAQVPPLESIKKMIPEDHLWPIDDYWEYHCARSYKFNNLNRYEKALIQRYGNCNNEEEFARIAQVMNYELMRPMFEAFRVNKGLTTGIIQWMYNSAWPAMYWQLFDSYLMPNGAFYGAKKALEPLQLIYNYADKSVYAVNSSQKSFSNLKAEMSIWGLDSKIKWLKSLTFEIANNSTKKVLAESGMNSVLDNLAPNQFLKLILLDSKDEKIGSNFYWLSTKADIPDFPKTEVYYTPVKQYADFTNLRNIPKVKIETYHIVAENNGEQKIIVTLHNSSDDFALFIELRVVGEKSGKSILPIYWEDNYISLAPGEERQISATFDKKDLNGDNPVFLFNGWNIINNQQGFLVKDFNETLKKQASVQ